MRDFLNKMRFAMEERLDGKAEKEAEHIVYARLVDFAQLTHAASKEMQEQWSIKVQKTEQNAGAGSVRVRMSQIEGAEPTYYLTTKVKGKAGECMEATMPCTIDYFTMFRFLAEGGMVKDRYRFPIQGSDLVWEIDVFKKPDGSYHDWVKIDLEVKDLEAPLPELPIQFAEVILPVDLQGPDQEKHNAVLDTLYSSVFNTPNMFLSGEIENNSVEETSEAPQGDATTDDNATGDNVDNVDSGDDAVADGATDAVDANDVSGTDSDSNVSEEVTADDNSTASTEETPAENTDDSQDDEVSVVVEEATEEQKEKTEQDEEATEKVGTESFSLISRFK